MSTDLAQSLGVLITALIPVIIAVVKQLQHTGLTAAYSAPRNGQTLPGGNGHSDLIGRILKLEQADLTFASLAEQVRVLTAKQTLMEETALEDRRQMNRFMASTNETLADIKTIVEAIKRATGEHLAVKTEGT